MQKNKWWLVISLFMAVFAASLATGAEQAMMPPADTRVQNPGMPVVAQGKIAFMERLGGYYVLVNSPPNEMMIVNQDTVQLDALFKSGKKVNIEGRIVIGADYLIIDQIDGKPYTVKPLPAVK